jgi:hypothetical protein
MEAVDLSPLSAEITESDRKFQSSFWHWYEKLASFCEKELIPGWADQNDQSPDKWPFY